MAKKTVKALVLRTAGTNCDEETAFAFRHFGAQADLIHIQRLFERKADLKDYHILAIPGGFTYGDDIMSGKILANELRLRLGEDTRRFISDGKLAIGICNGFQVLVRAGFLPGGLNGTSVSGGKADMDFAQTVTLTYNDSGKFEDRWTYLIPSGRCVWAQGIEDILFIPVAHAEGKFVPQNETVLRQLQDGGHIVFRYCNEKGQSAHYPYNPNGSVDDIAGITDTTGRILGLMPHPERHFHFTQHPYWTRRDKTGMYGDGAQIFQNGVNYVKKHLL